MGRSKDGRPQVRTVRGLLMHSSLVVTTAGVPLGLAAVTGRIRNDEVNVNGYPSRFPFGKKSVAEESGANDTEKSEEDIDKAAEELLTLMGDGEERDMAEVTDAPLPLVADEADEEVAEDVDALFTPMGNGENNILAKRARATHTEKSGTEGEDTVEMKDIFKEPTSPENLEINEESSGEAEEKNDEAMALEPESKGGDGILDNIFDQGIEIWGILRSMMDVPFIKK